MSNRLRLDRKQLASLFGNNHAAIVAFEKVLGDTNSLLPTTIEEAAVLAGSALAVAQQALALLAELGAAIEQLAGEPCAPDAPDADDTTPAHVHSQTDDYAPAPVPHQHESQALGAAATDLPSVIALANKMRLSLIANELGT